mgnify:CR=1 FL=1
MNAADVFALQSPSGRSVVQSCPQRRNSAAGRPLYVIMLVVIVSGRSVGRSPSEHLSKSLREVEHPELRVKKTKKIKQWRVWAGTACA